MHAAGKSVAAQEFLLNVIETAMDRVIAPPEGAVGAPFFADGFGYRYLGFDLEAGDPVEILAFEPRLVAAPGFGSTVGVRVARVSGARHTLFARVRRIERPTPESLLLVSDRVAGWRLADVLDTANSERMTLDMSAVLNLLRQLIPAVALFGRHQRDLTIGTLAPERLILTPQGRLVLAEYVFGDAIERLSMEPPELWRTFRITDAEVTGTASEGARSDVLAIGVVGLSLLLGRRLREDEFPHALADLLELVTESHGGDSRPLSPGLASWLARALQIPGHKALQSPKEAQVAFEELLATESGYVTSPAQLEAFITGFQQIAGPPPEPRQAEPAPPPALEPQTSARLVSVHSSEADREPAPVIDDLTSNPEFSWIPQPQQSYWEPLVTEPVTILPPPSNPPAQEESFRSEYQSESHEPPPWLAPPAAEAPVVVPPAVDAPLAPEPDVVPSPEPDVLTAAELDAVTSPELDVVPAPELDVVPSDAPLDTLSGPQLEADRPSEAQADVADSSRVAADADPVAIDATLADAPSGDTAAPPLATLEPSPAGSSSPGWLMKAVAGLTVLVVLEAAAILWLWNQSAAALLRDGELSVQSRPTAARVSVDDDDVGVTPVNVRLAPGTYSVKVQVGNAEPRIVVVQIKPGVQTAQYLELQTGR